MIAGCTIVHDPFHPRLHREHREVLTPAIIRDLVPVTDQPHVVRHNDQWLLRADWDAELQPNDSLVVVMLPQGGGGGSNPLKTILMIALAVAAGPIAGAIHGAGILTGISQGVLAGGVVFAGGALINALIPPPKPPTPQQATALSSPSPTYNLQAQGNSARLNAAIPVQYGRMMAFPDYAAQPYAEYVGNEQFLYSLLCIGVGQYSIEDIRIEDTPISNWEEITYEVVEPGDSVTLFPANVSTSIEVSGQDLPTGSAVGPYTANASGTDANALGIDLVAPRGLYYANDSGGLNQVTVAWIVEAREIDDSGTAAGSWVTLGTETLSAATTTPQRISRRYSVSSARYEVRVTRTDTEETSSRYGHDLVWSGLRAYLPETGSYGDVTLLAIRMRATGQLSAQASRKINVISTRKLPIWSGTAWSTETATSSIAWAIADIARAEYGAGLDDARIDLAGLLALDTTLTTRGDEFNGRLDNQVTLWEAWTQVCTSGRSKPFMQSGILHVVRDEAATIPVALFSMRNIRSGSFSIEYLMPTEQTADAVEVAYFDGDTWSPQRVTAYLPSSSNLNPAKIDLFGVTDRDQAYREGMYQAANTRYRRKVIRFGTEMDGFIPTPGDLIAISHDMPQWGQSAEVVSYTAAPNILPYSELLTNGVWSAQLATILASGTTPDGTAAFTLLEQSTGQHSFTNESTGADYDTLYTASGYIRSLYYSSTTLGLSTDDPAVSSVAVVFNLSAGTITSDPSGTASIESVGSGWYRVSASIMSSTAPYGPNISVTVISSTGPAYFAPVLSSSKFQVFSGALPGDYFATTATPPVATLTSSEPLTWDTGTHYVGLRARDGSVDGPIVVTAGADDYSLTLATLPDSAPYTGQDAERTHLAFGWAETWRQEARVVSIKPRGLLSVDIEAINEDSNVHTADQGITTPVVVYSQLGTIYTAPRVAGLVAKSSPSDVSKMLLSWQPAPGAEHYLIEQSEDGQTWTRTAEPRAANYALTAIYGSQTLVRIAAVGLTRGPWVQIAYGDSADYMWTTNPTAMWTVDTADMWG